MRLRTRAIVCAGTTSCGFACDRFLRTCDLYQRLLLNLDIFSPLCLTAGRCALRSPWMLGEVDRELWRPHEFGAEANDLLQLQIVRLAFALLWLDDRWST